MFLLSVSRRLLVVHILMWFISQDPTAHRFSIIDCRQTRRLAASSDATFSSGFGIGLPGEFRAGFGDQGRAYAEHIALRIGRDQVTRSHPERERLADILFGLSLPCKHECRLSSPSLENFDLERFEERSYVQITCNDRHPAMQMHRTSHFTLRAFIRLALVRSICPGF